MWREILNRKVVPGVFIPVLCTRLIIDKGGDHPERRICILEVMSDSDLLGESTRDEPQPVQNSEEVTNADLFSLVKTFMNDKFADVERNIDDKTHSLAKKVKKVETNLKFKGHQIQFELNTDLIDNIEVAIEHIARRKSAKATKVLEEALDLLRKRNKLIRIADKSEGGWSTVKEYLSDDVASDSEDEKRIRAAESRAVRKIKASKMEKKQSRKRPTEAAGAPGQAAHNGGAVIPTISTQQPFRTGQGQVGPIRHVKSGDRCYSCGNYGHWARECRYKDNKSSGFNFNRGGSV